MKRKVLLALLCLGVGSVLAIAASIPESVRMLSQDEKANMIAGTGCHNCTNWCDYEWRTCQTASYCEDYEIRHFDCGVRDVAVNYECKPWGSLIGYCEEPFRRACRFYEKCRCNYNEVQPPYAWYCDHYHDPWEQGLHPATWLSYAWQYNVGGEWTPCGTYNY
jgi:hypothetical protein